MTTGNQPEDPRAAYIDGLRVLASVLELHPEVPLPYEGRDAEMTIHFLGGDDPRAAMTATARAIPCQWAKGVRGDDYFDLHGRLDGLKIKLTAFRDDVCTRRVTGTREVTEEVPAPDAPKVTVTRVVDIVEWDCGPLLVAPEPACSKCGSPITPLLDDGTCHNTGACGRRQQQAKSPVRVADDLFDAAFGTRPGGTPR